MRTTLGLLFIGLVFCHDQSKVFHNKTRLPPNESKPAKNKHFFHATPLLEPEPTNFNNNWFRPISDAVTNFVTLTKHPNYGGVQLLNPINLWEKLHQKASSYFTGPYGATFGTASNGPLDYPFAYRKTKNSL